MAIISGTSESDALNGTSATDLLFGGGGDDVLYGGAGNDFLLGEDGTDVIETGAGSDAVAGFLGKFSGDVVTDFTVGGPDEAEADYLHVRLGRIEEIEVDLSQSGAEIVATLTNKGTGQSDTVVLAGLGATGMSYTTLLRFNTSLVGVDVFLLPSSGPVSIEAADDVFAVEAGGTVTGNLLLNDTPGSSVTAIDDIALMDDSITIPIAGGMLTVETDGDVRFEAAAGFEGTATASYTVGDGSSVDTATVRFTVTEPDPEPDPAPDDGPAPDIDLVAYWPAADETGSILENETGTRLDGLLRNGAQVTPSGIVGAGIVFDGTNDYVEVAHDPSLLLDEGGISFWFKADGIATDQGLFSKDAGFNGTGGHIDLRLLSGGTLWLRLQNVDSALDQILTLPNAISAGDWSHVVVGFGRDGLSLSLNGAVRATSAYAAGLGTSSGGAGNLEPLVLGGTLRASSPLLADQVTQPFRGMIDEVAILGTQPDASIVSDLYAAGLGGTGLLENNAAPDAVNDTATVAEDDSISIDVLANDMDADGAALSLVSVETPGHGTASIEDGAIRYTPDPDFAGADIFTYAVSNGSRTATASVSVTVTPLNDDPVGTDDAVTTTFDMPVTIDVLANDTDVDGDTLSIIGLSGLPSAGDTEIIDGEIVYTPNADFSGTDTFAYRLTDGERTGTAQVTVTVLDEVVAPPADPVPAFDIAAYWPVTDHAVPLLEDESGTGRDGALCNGAGGTAAGFVGGGLAFDGIDDHALIDHDPGLLLDEGGFSLWFNADRISVDQGLLSKDAGFNGTGGHVDLRLLSGGTLWLRLQNADAGLDQVLTVANAVEAGAWNHVVVGFGPGGLALSLNGAVAASNAYEGGLGASSGGIGNQEPLVLGGTLRTSSPLQADAVTQLFQGRMDEIAILTTRPDEAVVSDLYEAGLNGQSLVDPNVLPVAFDDTAVTAEDTAITIDVLANDLDADEDALTIDSVSDPAQGSARIENGAVLYTPDADAHGSDRFDYVVSDGRGGTATATVDVTVTPVDDPAEAIDDVFAVTDGTTVAGSVFADNGNGPDADPDGPALAVSEINGQTEDVGATVTLPSGALVTLQRDGTFFYAVNGAFSPAPGIVDTDEFTYALEGGGEPASVTIEITGPNAPPAAADDRFETDEDTVLSGNLLEANSETPDTDPDGHGLDVTRIDGFAVDVGDTVTLSSGALVTLEGDGGFRYDPNGRFDALSDGESTADDFTYRIDDGFGGQDSATVTVTVLGRNDAPVAVDDTVQTTEATSVAIDVLSNDTDAEGLALLLRSVSFPANGTAVLDGDRVIYTPDDGFTGTDTFTYVTEDAEGDQDTGSVAVFVDASDQRVSDGLLALYTFDEGIDTSTVYDVSGVGVPLDLTIDQPANVTWHDGYLSIEAGTLIRSAGAAVKLNDALPTSNALTIETWVTPDNSSQGGPARIATLSDGPFNRNVTLGQQGDEVNARLRTTQNDLNGNAPSVTTTSDALDTALSHIVYTIENETARIFVDTVLVATETIPGTFGNWDTSYAFALANELTGDRAWIGDLDLVAVFDRALSSEEIAQNFYAGPEGDAPNVPPQANDDSGRVDIGDSVTLAVLVNDADPNGTLDPDSLMILDGPDNGIVTVGANGTVAYQHTGTISGVDTFTYTVRDNRGAVSNEATVTVTINGSGPQDPPAEPFTLLSTETGDLPPSDHDEATVALIGDLNNDGLNDFVIAGRQTPSASAYVNQGNNQFVKFVIDSGSQAFEAGGALHDVDRDGDLDLVGGGDFRSNGIWWWENPGPLALDADTPWTEHVIKDSGNRVHHDLGFGDVDGDGTANFITWNQSSFNPNDPESRLLITEVPEDPAAGPWPFTAALPIWGEGLAIGDIDGDTVVDIVAGGRWIQSDGEGEFTIYDFAPQHRDNQVALGDIDGDGDLDAVFSSGDNFGPLVWFENDGTPVDGGWTRDELLDGLSIERGHSVEVVDFNGDGHLDIFTGEMRLDGGNEDAQAWVLFGDGAGSFETLVLSEGIGHHESTVGDLDGDGDADILGKPFNGGTPRLDIWLNNFDHAGPEPIEIVDWENWERIEIDSARPWRSVFLDTADINGDGWEDFVSAAWWYENPGEDGADWTRHTIGDPLDNYSAIHDFDGDGDLDIIGSEGRGPEINGNFVWAQNDGDGNFTVFDNVESGSGPFLQGSAVLRIEEDGPLEVILSWQLATGGLQALTVPDDPTTGVWEHRVISPVSQGEAIDYGDIDRDGDTDFLLGHQWLRNEGDDVWTPFTLHVPTVGEPDRVYLIDLNQDGRLDSLVGNGHDPEFKLRWFEQPEDPTDMWEEHVIDNLRGNPASLDFTDFDGDGDEDLVVGEHSNPDIGGMGLFVYENVDGLGGAWEKHTIFIGLEHHNAARLFDFDNDGDQDVVSEGWTHGVVSVFENRMNEVDGDGF